MKSYKILFAVFLVLNICAFSCTGNKGDQPINKPVKPQPKSFVEPPEFNMDSAYSFVKAQTDFGPRVTNSKGHAACKKYLIAKLKSYGLEIVEQDFSATTYDKTVLNGTNIIASYKPEAKRRVMLAAHWDTRPIADQDNDEAMRDKPILGANDGASGTAVLLEMARVISQSDKNLDYGIDFFFFDAEDYGAPASYVPGPDDKTSYYCLGSEYWANNKHDASYSAYFGVLFDMVGRENATFYKEPYSMRYAGSIMNKIWQHGHDLGYQAYFINQTPDGGVSDDHIPVNEDAQIPMIDIIDHDASNGDSYFPHFWHTHDDTPENVAPSTLKVVGHTVLSVLYNKII